MRRVTESIPVSTIITGRFRTVSDYANWRPQGTRDWLIIATTAGAGVFTSSTHVEFRAESRVLMLYAPGAFQDYRTCPDAGRWELLWAHFVPRPHWAGLLAWPEALPGLRRVDMRSEHATADWRSLIREITAMNVAQRRGTERAVEWSMNHLERALLIASHHVQDSDPTRRDERIDRAIAHIGQYLAEPTTIAILAELTGLSPSRFAHLFREVTGVTPQRFIERRRLERTVELLESTQLSVKEIAHEVGFANPFYLTLRFTRAFGTAPTHFRRARS
jgi:AraC family transcriptional regulator of arabinose operon